MYHLCGFCCLEDEVDLRNQLRNTQGSVGLEHPEGVHHTSEGGQQSQHSRTYTGAIGI